MEELYESSLDKVLVNHENRIERIEGFPTGCEYTDEFFVVIPEDEEPPPYEVCGICYYIIGTEGCTDTCEEEPPVGTPCEGCVEDVMGSSSWVAGRKYDEEDVEWDPILSPPLSYNAEEQFYYGTHEGQNALYWDGELLPTPQSFQCRVTNMGLSDYWDYFGIELNRDYFEQEDRALRMEIGRTSNPALYSGQEWYFWMEDSSSSVYYEYRPDAFDPMFAVWPYGDEFTVRFEAESVGFQNYQARISINDEVVHTAYFRTARGGSLALGFYTNCLNFDTFIAPPYDKAVRIHDICMNDNQIFADFGTLAGECPYPNPFDEQWNVPQLAPCWYEQWGSSRTPPAGHYAAGFWHVEDGYLTNKGDYAGSPPTDQSGVAGGQTPIIVRSTRFGTRQWWEMEISGGLWNLTTYAAPILPNNPNRTAQYSGHYYIIDLNGPAGNPNSSGWRLFVSFNHQRTIFSGDHNYDATSPRLIRYQPTINNDFGGGMMTYKTYAAGTEPTTVVIRVELPDITSKTVNFYINGELVKSHTTTQTTVPLNPRMAMMLHHFGMNNDGPHINWIKGGSDPVPMVGTWTLPPNNVAENEVNYPLEQGYEAAAVEDVLLTPEHEMSGAMWALESEGNQFIEVCVNGLSFGGDYPVDQHMDGELRVFLQGDGTTTNWDEASIRWGLAGSVGFVHVESYRVNADGTRSTIVCEYDEIPWDAYFIYPTVCFRFESEMEGAHRLYMDVGEVGAFTKVAEGIAESGLVGRNVGFLLRWSQTSSETGVSPQVKWMRAGIGGQSGGGICFPEEVEALMAGPAIVPIEEWRAGTGERFGGFRGPPQLERAR